MTPRIPLFGCLALCLTVSPSAFGDDIVQCAAKPIATRKVPAFPAKPEALPASIRDKAMRVVQQPTLVSFAPAEDPFRVGLYDWLLDHPDRAATAWQRLGIKCCDIHNHGNGKFGCTDPNGSTVVWFPIFDDADYRIWYVEGQARPGPMMPLAPVQAVAVLHHVRYKDKDGRNMIEHDAWVYLQTDSKAAALVTRMLGQAAPRMADQATEQLLLFYSGLTRYFNHHPEDVTTLLKVK